MLVASERSPANLGGSADAPRRSGLLNVSRNQPPSRCGTSDSVRIQCSAPALMRPGIPGSAPVALRQRGRGLLVVLVRVPVRFVLGCVVLVVIILVVIVIVIVLVFVIVGAGLVRGCPRVAAHHECCGTGVVLRPRLGGSARRR